MTNDPISKAQSLEDKIKELRDRQKKYIEKAQKEIGRYLMETWDIEDIQQAKMIIDSLKEQAKQHFNSQEQMDDSSHRDPVTNG